MAKKKICFVVSPIGEEDSDIRKRSDQILKHIIKPPVSECGYKAIRADEIDKPGMITSQVIQHIIDDPLVIADLTGHNPNVFYELAIRHAIRKPFIQIIKKGEKIPFDIGGMRTIGVDLHNPDSVSEAKDKITEQVKSLEKDNSSVETPIATALDLQALNQSKDPQQKILAEIMPAINNLPLKIEESILGKLPRRSYPVERERKSQRVVHMMFEPVRHMDKISKGEPIMILVFASIVRDDAPWLYEIAIEAYRAVAAGTQKSAKQLMRSMEMLRNLSKRDLMFEELIDSEEAHMLTMEGPRLLERMVMRCLDRKGLLGK
jgi:hypothetical protein